MISVTHNPRMRAGAYTVSVFLALFFSVLAPNCYNDYRQLDQRWQKIHVDSKEAVKMHNGKYLVYTQNEVFEVSDSWIEWIIGNPLAMASSDTYGMIEEGKDYRIRTRGFRWPFWSFYRNIVEIKDITSDITGTRRGSEKPVADLQGRRKIPPTG